MMTMVRRLEAGRFCFFAGDRSKHAGTPGRGVCVVAAAALLLLATVHATASEPASAEDTARQARLQERMTKFREAFAKADVAVLEGMLAPNYVHTNDRSAPLPRARWLEGMAKSQAARAAGQSTTTEFKTDNVTLSVWGDTAVGTGVTTMRGVRNGSPFGLRINFTQVWAWDGKDWYRVAFHDTYETLKD